MIAFYFNWYLTTGIIHLKLYFQDDDTIYLIFELLSGGDLRRSLEDQNHLPEARVLIYTSELALALDYLQTKRILHRCVSRLDISFLIYETGGRSEKIYLSKKEKRKAICFGNLYSDDRLYNCLKDCLVTVVGHDLLL